MTKLRSWPQLRTFVAMTQAVWMSNSSFKPQIPKIVKPTSRIRRQGRIKYSSIDVGHTVSNQYVWACAVYQKMNDVTLNGVQIFRPTPRPSLAGYSMTRVYAWTPPLCKLAIAAYKYTYLACMHCAVRVYVHVTRTRTRWYLLPSWLCTMYVQLKSCRNTRHLTPWLHTVSRRNWKTWAGVGLQPVFGTRADLIMSWVVHQNDSSRAMLCVERSRDTYKIVDKTFSPKRWNSKT